MDPSTRSFSAEDLLAESQWIQALARSLVREPEAAEDLVQETWLAALRRRPAVRESLRPWLARVLRNQAALLRRNRLRGARDQADAVDEPLPSAADLVVRAETHRLLVGAIIELEEPYRSTVLLRYYEGLSSAEIARRRRVPSATVRTQLRRALERLREKLDQDHGGDRQRWVLALGPAASADAGSPGEGQTAAEAAAAPLAGIPAAAVTALAIAAAVGALSLLHSRGDPRAAAPEPQELVAAAMPEEVPLPAARAAVEPETPAEAMGGAGALGPLSATVVDDRTREPLPHFEVELTLARGVGSAPPSESPELEPAVRVAWARTGENGRFTTAESLPAATYEVRLIDDPRVRDQDAIVHGEERVRATVPRATVRLDPTLEGVHIPSPTGPTYPLRLALPPGLELSDLRAHLRSPEQFWTLQWQLHLAPVRHFAGDEVAWVRFGHLCTKFLDSEPPWLLEVTSADGLWAGSAEVRSIAGVHGIVDLDLRAKGILAGTVQDALGPVTSDVVAILRPSDGMGEERRVSPDGRGAYALAWVEPGAYRLAFESHRHLVARKDVLVVAGERIGVDVHLERRSGGGSIRGTLASRSGAYRGTIVLALAPRSHEAKVAYAAVTWNEEGGALLGRFAFDDVPVGEYELRIVSCSDQLAWSPAVQRVTPPAEAHFECADGVELTDLGFRVVDARDRREIDRAIVLYETAGRGVALARKQPERAPDDPRSGLDLWGLRAEGLVWTHVPGPYPIRGFPADGSLRWIVAAPGYRPVYGDETAFLPEAGGRRAEVALHPGWGLQLRVVDEVSSQPVEGVEVLADGAALGRTDPGGMLRIELGALPGKLAFEYAGHRVAGGDLDPLQPPAVAGMWIYEVRIREER